MSGNVNFFFITKKFKHNFFIKIAFYRTNILGYPDHDFTSEYYKTNQAKGMEVE